MLQKTPCFIRYPDMEQTGKIDTIGGEIDIMPTVANLMGIDVPYAFGKDLFNCGEGYVVLRNSSVITPEYSYINSNSTLYDANGNSVELSNNMDTKKYNYKKMQQALNISDIILNKDYFSKIEGEK
jgi:phosphoglycerol transferase MdoB-like AlkP superfamily enzyme